jgi:hypothetical protein
MGSGARSKKDANEFGALMHSIQAARFYFHNPIIYNGLCVSSFH